MRLRFRDFRELAEHVSIAWRGYFTEEELDEMAADDYSEYRQMLEDRNYMSEDLFSLAERLKEDIDNGVRIDCIIRMHRELTEVIGQNGRR